jgi:hypothetical protein
MILLTIVLTILLTPCYSVPSSSLKAGIHPDSSLQATEAHLKQIAAQILYGENDSVRSDACQSFLLGMKEALTLPGSFRYPFDSLVTIARIYAPDSSFRLINWNLPLNSGGYEYFAFIQPSQPSPVIFTLSDISEDIQEADQAITSFPDWYGALYYRIILTKSGDRDYYTLLGWDGYSQSSTRKIIDILTFDERREPVFGARLFPDYMEGTNTRVIFEHAENASMSLKYDLQTYRQAVGSNKKRTKYKVVTTWMIVFDHLVPMDASLTGQYSFYIPSGITYDAFVFLDGNWHYYESIDARNPETEEDEVKSKKSLEYDLVPPARKPRK